jgi:hypothetical protein
VKRPETTTKSLESKDTEATSAGCCSTSELATCCEPSAKRGCCGPRAEDAEEQLPVSCGCR